MDPQTRTVIRYLGLEPPESYAPDRVAVDVIAVALAAFGLIVLSVAAGWLG